MKYTVELTEEDLEALEKAYKLAAYRSFITVRLRAIIERARKGKGNEAD